MYTFHQPRHQLFFTRTVLISTLLLCSASWAGKVDPQLNPSRTKVARHASPHEKQRPPKKRAIEIQNQEVREDGANILLSFEELGIPQETAKMHYEGGLIHFDNNRMTSAIEAFNTALEHIQFFKPEDQASIFHHRGLAYFNEGKLLKSLEDYTSSLDVENENVLGRTCTLLERARVNHLLGNYQAAVEDCDAVLKLRHKGRFVLRDTRRKEAHYQKGFSLFRQSNNPEAIKHLSLALRGETLAPHLRPSAIHCRMGAFARLGQWDQAIKNCDHALQLKTEGISMFTGEPRVKLLISKAGYLLAQGKINPWPKIITAMCEAIGIMNQGPTAKGKLRAQAHARRCRSYEELGDIGGAIKDLESLLSLTEKGEFIYQGDIRQKMIVKMDNWRKRASAGP